jgi:hypothetical protein
MLQSLTAYFQTPALFQSAIKQYENDYINNPRRDWSLTGRLGKFAAYTFSEQAFDGSINKDAQLCAVSKILQVVQSWNGDLSKPAEIQKYGDPVAILKVLHSSGDGFRRGNLTLSDLTAEHYLILVAYLNLMAVIKSHSSYAWIPISKFLHIMNPSLFPIYDDRNVWYRLMAPRSSKPAGVFSDDYIEFCNHPNIYGQSLLVRMKPVDWTSKFNANYTFWACKHMSQASPELMPYFAQWFCQYVGGMPDPYNLKSDANKLYALAFEVVSLGAGSLESASR